MLEEKLPKGNEDKEKGLLNIIKTQVKEYAVDTSVSLIYANLVFGAGEYLIVGMDSEEVIKTRIGMSIIGLGVYRPFGKFREYWAKLLKSDENSSFIKKTMTEISAGAVFFTPIYAGVTFLSGVSFEEIALSATIGAVLTGVTARPYGWCLDKSRKLFGIKPVLDSYDKK